jgi:UTP--glucose-1-phosphate uridylyltransferase
MHVSAMVEKPHPEEAPSTYSIVGRYILPPEIHEILRSTPRGAGGEIQLTDALAVLAARGEAWGYEFEGLRFDTGNVLGLFEATLHFIQKRPELADRARELIQRYSG